jgi:hypothetical protein
MQVTAAPGRKALAAANRIYVQHDWKKPDDTLSKGNTQVQQPLLDDAWKHLQARIHAARYHKSHIHAACT